MSRHCMFASTLLVLLGVVINTSAQELLIQEYKHLGCGARMKFLTAQGLELQGKLCLNTVDSIGLWKYSTGIQILTKDSIVAASWGIPQTAVYCKQFGATGGAVGFLVAIRAFDDPTIEMAAQGAVIGAVFGTLCGTIIGSATYQYQPASLADIPDCQLEMPGGTAAPGDTAPDSRSGE